MWVPGSLQEQQAFLVTKPSPQPLLSYIPGSSAISCKRPIVNHFHFRGLHRGGAKAGVTKTVYRHMLVTVVE